MTLNSDTSASDTIDAYRKRQQRGPVIVWIIAALFVIVGIVVLIIWLTGDNKPTISFLSTETPTSTLTATLTVTPSPTLTPIPTLTATATLTPLPPTASAPFSYTIQEGESFTVVAEKFGLDEESGILLLLQLNPTPAARGFVLLGEEIMVPNPDMKLPTATSVPVDLKKGTELEYTIRPGDTIAAIAIKFRSTSEAILELNEIDNPNTIQAGQVLLIPANLVTAEPTRLPPTSPPNATATPITAGNTPTPFAASCDYEENANFITQIFELVNTERVRQGLSPLAENQKLTAAAMLHALDMACNDFSGEIGSDGSTAEERVAAQDYVASLVLQEVVALPPEYGGDGQAAFDVWMGGTTLLNPNVTEMGIAYAYSSSSTFGGYFTIILAAP